MRKINLFLAAALTVGACTPKSETIPVVSEDAQLSLEVSVPSVRTKATGGDDSSVNCFQVFVYRTDGTLEVSAYGTENEQTVKVSQGAKTIAVLANHEKISSNLSFSALKALTLDLGENGASSVLMYGTEDVLVNQDTSVEVEISRLVARIEVDKVTNGIEMDQYKGLPLTVKSIFLTNVVGTRTVEGAASTPVWLNRMSNQNDLPALLCDKPEASIAAGSSYSAEHHFYCFPNSAAEADGATWSPRPTRLVVELQLGDEQWFYPVSIPSVMANKCYVISDMTVTRIGTKNPDEVLEFNSLTFTIKVKDWESTSSDVII